MELNVVKPGNAEAGTVSVSDVAFAREFNVSKACPVFVDAVDRSSSARLPLRAPVTMPEESTPTRRVLSCVAILLRSPLLHFAQPDIVTSPHVLHEVEAVSQSIETEHSSVGFYL